MLGAVLRTKHQHILTLAVDGQVTGQRQCLENGDLVGRNLNAAAAARLSENRERKSGILHDYRRVEQHLRFQQFIFDQVGHFQAVESGHVDRAQRRHLDVPLRIDGIIPVSAVIARAVIVVDGRQVKEVGQLAVPAEDIDLQAVSRLQGKLLGFLHLHRHISLKVLQIAHLRRLCAGSQQEHRQNAQA